MNAVPSDRRRAELPRAVLLLSLLLLASGVASAARAANVHVAPDGDDSADGRSNRPVATLRRALDIVRELRRRGSITVPVTVEVADGRYELAETLVVARDDSGTEKSPTIVRAAAGARPVFSGGRRIAGWTVEEVDGRPRWTAPVPEVRRGKWRFTQLFVDGQRRFRPSLPAEGWYAIRRAAEPSAEAGGKGHDRFVAAAAEVAGPWSDRDAIEVVAGHRRSMSRLRIGAVEPTADGAEALLTLVGVSPSAEPWGAFAEGGRYRLENVREALGAPGSWYLDAAAATLTYCPRDGETPETTEVVAPRLDTLVAFRGETADERKLTNVRFEGLSFEHGNWPMPPRGQAYPDGDLNVGAAVTFTGVRSVTLARCGVRHVGRYAVSFGVGTHECVLEGCEFVDLGAGGVMVGTITPPGDRFTAVTRNVVRDCTIRAAGRLHAGGIGVWIGLADRTTVERCEIADLSSTAVWVGWPPGYAVTEAAHSVVRGNHIHDVGQGVLSDLAGVSTRGAAPGVIVSANRIHDVTARDGGGWGLSAEEGSSGVMFRGNVVHRTSSGGFHQREGRGNVVENNVFAASRDRQLERTGLESHTGLAFNRNIVWWLGEAPLAAGDWSARITARDNLYWHGNAAVVFPDGKDLAARKAAGLERGSRVADPLFADAAAGGFDLSPDSPAFALGFEPIDLSSTGRITPAGLAPDLPEVPSPWTPPPPAAP